MKPKQMRVFVVSRSVDWPPQSAFSTKEAAALFIYETVNSLSDYEQLEITELVLDGDCQRQEGCEGVEVAGGDT